MRTLKKETLLRSTILAGIAALSMSGTPVFAQAEGDEAEEATTQSEDVIKVTGSLLRRSEFNSASPIQVLTSEVASLAGLVDTAEILQGSTIAAGSVQINSEFGGFVIDGGLGTNTLSLRGLGSQRTLLLFNGRRLGPSGTQGAVSAVDLSVIPSSIVLRQEILKDGASTIYGSDAVAGVVNVITRTEIDDPEWGGSVSVPFESGGEVYQTWGALGKTFDRGFVTLSAEYSRSEALKRRDRDYLRCPESYVFDAETGERYDGIERNPRTSGQGEFKCLNTFYETIVTSSGRRFIADDNAAGQAGDEYFDGFRARGQDGFYTQNGIPIGGNEQRTTGPRPEAQDVLPEEETLSIYLTGEYNAGFTNLYGELLYNNRQTSREAYRQLFPVGVNPLVYGGDVPGVTDAFLATSAGGGTGEFGTFTWAQPVLLIPYDSQADVDYYYGVVGAEGNFSPNAGFFSDWSYDAHLSHSRSEGTYSSLTVDARNVMDAADPRTDIAHTLDASTGNVICTRISTGESCPAINYYSARIHAGEWTQEEYDFLFATDVGETVYTQTNFRAIITGDAFELPAGTVGMALGYEYRASEIDDQPGELSVSGNQWGLASAVNTQGEDSLHEAFIETEFPILAGAPLAEELTLNVSGRYFDYKLYDADTIYKVGLNWQINPAIRLRATNGTTFRAPGLFELYLGDAQSFASQTTIDPCIEWGESTNQYLRTNCAAAGVPDDYLGAGSSAQLVTSGGAGQLEPETAESTTFGLIFTPSDINLSVALDYFDVTIENQVASLSAGAILGGCYGAEVFPNSFCDLFDRDMDPSSTTYLNITQVRPQYININSQTTSGLDITVRYEHEFDFGELIWDFRSTHTFEDVIDTFAGSDGFEIDDFNGTIGNADFVAESQFRLTRGDWTYSWATQFYSRQSRQDWVGDNLYEYVGDEGTRLVYDKIHVEPVFIHTPSVRYSGADWELVVGVRNLFGEEPSAVSNGVGTRVGNAALFANGQDLRGRRAFMRFNKAF